MATVQAVLGNLTVTERGILMAINTGASSLSFVGSGFIVLCYLVFTELRKFSFKLVFFLALSDMFCSFFSIIGDPSKGFFCYAQGYTTHFFCVASFLWTTTIAFTLHRTVVRHKADVEDFEPMFHLYVWGTSGIMTVLRSIGNDHGHIRRLGTWCWAQSGRKGKVVHFITFYAPLWGAILFNGITYFQVIRMLNNATRMLAGMSERPYQSDARLDTKVHITDGIKFVRDIVSTPDSHNENDKSNGDVSNGSSIRVHGDKKSSNKIDILIIDVDSSDLSSGLTCPASEFVEESFLLTVKHSLSKQGLFVINLVSRSTAVKDRVFSRLRMVFSNIFSLRLEEDLNEIIFALNDSSIEENQFPEACDVLTRLLKLEKPEWGQSIIDGTKLIERLR